MVVYILISFLILIMVCRIEIYMRRNFLPLENVEIGIETFENDYLLNESKYCLKEFSVLVKIYEHDVMVGYSKNFVFNIFDTFRYIFWKQCLIEKNIKNSRINKKTNKEIVIEILDGKWGNGEFRKLALQRAGYDRKAIQIELDTILATRKFRLY